MNLVEIFPAANTVQQVSQFFVNLGETGRWCYYTIEALLFYSLLSLSIYASTSSKELVKGRSIKRIIISDLTFCGLLIFFILVARVPLAIMGLQNPDEPLWAIDAKTLLHDPRIFVSVDTSTGGPLVPFFLLLLKLFGLPIDQGTLKIMSGAMMAFSTGFLFLGGVKALGSTIARLTILPLVVLIALMRDNDLIAYNSEHPVIFLLCVSLYFLARLVADGPGKYNLNLVMLGIFLGSVPFAKLQGAPIAFFVGMAGCFVVLRRDLIKRMPILILSSLAPVVIFVIALWSYNGLKYFWVSHILQNLLYASQVAMVGNFFNAKMELFFRILFIPKELSLFLYYSLITVFFGSFLTIAIPGRLSAHHRMLIIFSLLFLAVSIYCITTPNRAFGHYGLLSLVPLTMLSAILVSCACSKACGLLDNASLSFSIVTSVSSALFLLVTSFYFFTVNFTYQPYYLSKIDERYNGYAPQGAMGAVLDHYYAPNAKLAVWEDEAELFESNEFVLGTRFGVAGFNSVIDSIRPFFTKTYLNDLIVNEPKLFVYRAARSADSFENYPDISNHIKENFTRDSEFDGYHIYVRNNKLSEKKPWKIEKPKMEEFNPGFFHGDLQTLQKNGTFLQFGGWTVMNENVIDQRPVFALISRTDTTYVDTFRSVNKGVVDFSHKPNYKMSGFGGFIPLNELPDGDLQAAIMVVNNGTAGFKLFSQKVNRDLLLLNP